MHNMDAWILKAYSSYWSNMLRKNHPVARIFAMALHRILNLTGTRQTISYYMTQKAVPAAGMHVMLAQEYHIRCLVGAANCGFRFIDWSLGTYWKARHKYMCTKVTFNRTILRWVFSLWFPIVHVGFLVALYRSHHWHTVPISQRYRMNHPIVLYTYMCVFVERLKRCTVKPLRFWLVSSSCYFVLMQWGAEHSGDCTQQSYPLVLQAESD